MAGAVLQQVTALVNTSVVVEKHHIRGHLAKALELSVSFCYRTLRVLSNGSSKKNDDTQTNAAPPILRSVRACLEVFFACTRRSVSANFFGILGLLKFSVEDRFLPYEARFEP